MTPPADSALTAGCEMEKGTRGMKLVEKEEGERGAKGEKEGHVRNRQREGGPVDGLIRAPINSRRPDI